VKIIGDGVARYRAWKGGDETVAFPLITDVYEKETLPALFCVGNHDHAKQRYTSKQFGDTFNRRKDMMIDLVAIKPEKRLVHVFRFGCGGPKSELEYGY